MADTETDTDGVKAGRTPPYVSFKSFTTLIEELKTNGLPPQIDRSVLRRFSGGLGSQLLMATKSLGLVADDNKPTPRGAKLVAAFGTDAWKETLRGVIATSYPFLNDLDLTQATPSMFAEAFKRGTGAKEDVLRKCRSFFLHAAQDADIPIGPRILNGSVPRSPAAAGTTKRKPKAAKAKVGTGGGEEQVRHQHHHTPAPATETVAQALLAKFPPFDPGWTDDIKAKWFDGYERLLKMGEKDSG